MEPQSTRTNQPSLCQEGLPPSRELPAHGAAAEPWSPGRCARKQPSTALALYSSAHGPAGPRNPVALSRQSTKVLVVSNWELGSHLFSSYLSLSPAWPCLRRALFSIPSPQALEAASNLLLPFSCYSTIGFSGRRLQPSLLSRAGNRCAISVKSPSAASRPPPHRVDDVEPWCCGPMPKVDMLMRGVPTRPLLSRYGLAVFAALLIYCVFIHPVLNDRAHPHAKGPGDDQSNVPNGVPLPEQDALNPGVLPEQQLPIEAEQQPGKIYKPMPESYAPIEDPFPWLTVNNKPPPILSNNLPPDPHVPEHTPLLIGFTRNWPMLIQCVASYIAAGWPAEDIYVVENTGTFRANKDSQLSLQNPFYLNHTQLKILGAHVLTTPTLLSFAQLQNYFLHTALQRGWETFFWSHQDVLVFSDEEVKKKDRDHDYENDPYATIYERAVGLMRYLNGPGMPEWATHFFAYDHLTLVKRDAYLEVGAWDTHIPFYATDCDMYLRLHWAGYWQPQSEAGLVFDVNSRLDDVGALFRLPRAHASFEDDPLFTDPNRPLKEAEQEQEYQVRAWVEKEGESFQHLVAVAERMMEAKWVDQGIWRNTWQTKQSGGEGEPYYRDPSGFEEGVKTLIEAGRRVFAEKWGHRGCNLIDMGIEPDDAWRLERDWDPVRDGPGSEGGDWGKDWTGID
ncbi:hypothetical protein SCUP515_08148 [Seiridium cupressi]